MNAESECVHVHVFMFCILDRFSVKVDLDMCVQFAIFRKCLILFLYTCTIEQVCF